MNDHDSSTSKFLVDDYEGISSDFIEMEPLPSREGYCDLFKAKRYGRWYLLKCLKEKEATYPVYQQMFRKEFEISVALQHQSVVQVTGLETVKLPDGRTALCIISEWIDGVTLSEYLKGASGSSVPSVNERRRVAEELAEAVAYIHSQQVVHRDLKPSNIMITNNGNYVKVIDFGLADTSSHAILKQPAGTMRYMAPEQMQTSMADVRNDIYSLGVILQEMNLGGGKYRRVVERCLRPMEQRYQQMDDLLKDLHSRRGQYLMWGVVAAVVVAVVTLLLWQVSSLQRRSVQMEKEAAEQQLQLKILNHEIIGFDDPEVQRLCVAHWDTDGDGQLSYKEAAAVDSLGQVFTGNKKILSFDELENFTGLTAIDANAFRDCESLQSVRLPISVRFIRSNAFRHTAIERFKVPGTVAGLGDHFMEDCPNLETVIFESRLPQNNMTEESVPFVNCPKLTTIFVPDHSIIQLRQGKHMKESGVDLQTAFTLRSEGQSAVAVDPQKKGGVTNGYYTYRLWLEWGLVFPLMTDHVRFADQEVHDICVKRWDRDGDRELSIEEAEAVQTLGSAFTANPKITSFDELSFFTGVKELPNSAFDNCYNMKSVSLPSSLKVIGSYAFSNCACLQSITLPSHLEKLGEHAFQDCDLEEIFIPASVASISPSTFNGNHRLRKVVVSKDNPVYDSRENCNAIIETATNTMVSGSVTAFFPRSVDKMSEEPFSGYSRPSIVIPKQIKAIGQWAFACKIDTIYCESPVPPTFNSNNGTNILFQYTPIIIVPKGSRNAYAKADGWRYYLDGLREKP